MTVVLAVAISTETRRAAFASSEVRTSKALLSERKTGDATQSFFRSPLHQFSPW